MTDNHQAKHGIALTTIGLVAAILDIGNEIIIRSMSLDDIEKFDELLNTLQPTLQMMLIGTRLKAPHLDDVILAPTGHYATLLNLRAVLDETMTL